MRCISCSVQMLFVRIEPDEISGLENYAHHIFQCPECNALDQRFMCQSEVEVPATPSSSQSDANDSTPQSTWMQALERVRSKQTALDEEEHFKIAAARLRQFNRSWETFVPQKPRQYRDRLNAIKQKPDPQPPTTLAELVARLRTQKIPAPIEITPDLSQRFDTCWDAVTPESNASLSTRGPEDMTSDTATVTPS
jgi:hypothetical protein